MFFASVALFATLAHIDEYESLVTPFFPEETKEKKTDDIIEKGYMEVESIIRNFNAALSEIYLSSDPSRVRALPVDEKLKKVVADDIAFLNKNGKVMNVSVGEIKLEDIRRLSPFELRVRTREIVSLSYLNAKDGTVSMPRQDAEYKMVYTLGMKDGRWIVIRYETAGVESLSGKRANPE